VCSGVFVGICMCWRFLRFAFWPPALPGQTPEVGVAAVRELRSTAFPSVPVSNFLFVHKYIGKKYDRNIKDCNLSGILLYKN